MAAPDPVWLAEKLQEYNAAHAIAAEVVCSDPARRDQYMATLNAGPSTVPQIGPEIFGTSDAVDRKLEQLDQQLSREPKTFDDYLHRMYYAFSAAVLFNKHKVMDTLRGDEEGYQKFAAHWSALNAAFCASRRRGASVDLSSGFVPAAPTSEHIDQEQAVKLCANTRTLFAKQFVLRASDSASDGEGMWKVSGCYCTAESTSYDVVFDDDGCSVRMNEEQLIRIIKGSRLMT